MKDKSLRVLIIEDSKDDALLIIRELKKGGYNPAYERVETAAAMKKALKEKQWDIIVCDYTLPKFNAPSAIAVLKKANIDIPLIVISGTIGETVVAECMRLVAHDYIMKSNLSRLCPVIARELKEAKVRKKQKHAENALLESEKKYKLIAEKMTDIIWITDINMRLRYISPSIRTVLGFSQEEEMQKTLDQQLTPDSLAIAIETNARELAFEKKGHGDPNRNVNLILEYYHKDGSTRWMETIIIGLRNEQGVLTGLHGVSRDITERRRMEEKLRESEANYRQLFENSPAAIYRVDFKSGRFLKANDLFCEYLGCSQEEITSISPYDLLTKESKQLLLERLEKMALGIEVPETVEYEGFDKKGKQWCLQLHNKNIYDAEGHVVASDVVAHDITEHKKAEEALKKSEEKYRQLAETTHDIIITVDFDFNITYGNKEVIDFVGVSDNVGRNLLEFTSPEMHELQKAIMQKRREGFSDTLAFEWEIIRHDGVVRTFEIKGTLLKDDGNPSGVMFVARDITKRKKAENALRESEKKYKLLTEKMIDMVWTKNMNLQTTYISPSIQKLLGYSPEERINQTIDQQVTPESLSVLTETLIRELAIEKSGKEDPQSTTLVLEYYHKDGSTRWMETILSWIRNDQGVTTGIHGVSRDITERKRVEEKLRESETNYRQLFENSPAGIYRVDFKSGRFLKANDVFCKYVGRNQEEITSLSPYDVLTEESKKLLRERVRKMALGEEVPETVEYEIIDKNGKQRYVHLINKMIYDSEGHVVASDVVAHDITERKLAEDALRQKTALLEAQLNSSIEGILVVDRQGKKVLQNQRANDLWKIPQHIADNDDDQMQVQHVMHMTVNPEQFVEKVTYLYNHQDETTRDEVELTDGTVLDRYSAPVLGKDGQNYGRIWAFRDITERKKAEENLRQSEEKYRNIIESIEDGYAELDLKGNFLFVNNALCKIDGYPKNELMKLNYRDIMDEENAKKIYAAYHKVFITGESEKNFEYEIITKNGIRKYLETSVQPIKDADNRVIAFRGIVRDRTERKLAEEKFYKIFMTTPDCIAITRLKDGLITDVNKGFEDIVGWKREEAIGTKSTESPLKFWIDLSERELMVEDLRAGRDVLHRQFEFRRRDGSIRTGIYSARPINIAGEASIIFIMQDITEQKRMASELVESQKMKLMSQIVSGVAHEVRNPLHAIQAISEAMAIDLKEDIEYKDYLMHIKAQVERLSHLMNDLLELGKPIQLSQFSKALLSEIASAALKSWMEAHPQLSQTVKVVNNLRSDDIVLVDTNKIQQVIINLMENAAQHSPQGEEILFTLGKVSKKCFMVEIIDKGVGLKPQDKPKVFEPFYTTRKSGTGLGLSLCKHIIESHGGSIDIFNNKNASGCTARFTLPVYNSKEHK